MADAAMWHDIELSAGSSSQRFERSRGDEAVLVDGGEGDEATGLCRVAGEDVHAQAHPSVGISRCTSLHCPVHEMKRARASSARPSRLLFPSSSRRLPTLCSEPVPTCWTRFSSMNRFHPSPAETRARQTKEIFFVVNNGIVCEVENFGQDGLKVRLQLVSNVGIARPDSPPQSCSRALRQLIDNTAVILVDHSSESNSLCVPEIFLPCRDLLCCLQSLGLPVRGRCNGCSAVRHLVDFRQEQRRVPLPSAASA